MKRKAEKGCVEQGPKKSKILGIGQVQSGKWCLLGNCDQVVQVTTGLRKQITRPRSTKKLSRAVRGLTQTLEGDTENTRPEIKQSMPEGVVDYKAANMIQPGYALYRNEALPQARIGITGTSSVINRTECNVQRLRESILKSLTDHEKAVLVTLPAHKRRALIKKYVEREMQLELQSRLQHGVPHRGVSCPTPDNLAQIKLSPLLDHPATSTILQPQYMQDSGANTKQYQQLQSASLSDNNCDQANLLHPETKSGLIFTEVGQGQYVCTGIPRMMAFGSPLQLLPMNVDWPVVSGDPPVRTLHGQLSPLKTTGLTPDKISYVVPVSTTATGKHRTAKRPKASIYKPRGPSPGTSGPSVKCQTNYGYASAQKPAAKRNHLGLNRRSCSTKVIGTRKALTVPASSEPVSMRSKPGCLLPVMGASLVQNACDSKFPKDVCFQSLANAIPKGCLGNSCASSAGSSARVADATRGNRPAVQDDGNAGENRKKLHAVPVPYETNFSSAKRILSLPPNYESSCSSNISYMDPSTRELLAALDSGELSSSLLDNPFV